MRAKSQKTKNEASKAAADGKRPRRRRRWLRFVLFLAVLILGAGLYLTLIGLPEPVLRRIEARLASHGHHLEVRRIRLDVLDGIVVEGVQLFPEPEAVCACVTADRIALEVNPLEWFRKKSGLRGARIRGGTFRTHSASGLTGLKAEDDPSNITLENISGHVRLESTGLALEDLTASLFGVTLEGSGYLVRPNEPVEGSLFQAWLSLFRDRPEEERERPAWVQELVEQLNAVNFGQDPRGTIAFSLHPLQLDSNEITIAAVGKKAQGRGEQFDEWRVKMRLRGPRMDLVSASLRAGEREMRLSGSFDFNTETAEAEVYSTLRPETCNALLPVRMQKWLKERRVLPEGEVEAELTFGPAHYRALAQTLKGRVTLQDARWRETALEECRMFVERNGDVVQLTDIEAVVGKGKDRGDCSATLTYDLASRAFSGQAATHFGPHAVRSLVGETLASVIDDFSFSESHPACTFSFSGVMGDSGTYGIQGHVAGTNFSFRGPLLHTFAGDMKFTNSVLRFENLDVQREEGGATGMVALDFARDVVDMDVISSINPKAVAQVIGPAAISLLEPFEFEGPTHITAKGTIDYAERREMDLQAVINAEKMHYDWLVVDRCSFNLSGKDETFEVRDGEGETYGGTFEGEAILEPEGSTADIRYGVRGSYTNIDFRLLMEDAKGLEDSDPYQGLVEGNVKMSGLIGKGQCATVNGAGNLRIKEGSLMRVPLFGGLSRFLARIYPGLGFIAQTDFRTDFKIHDCELRARNMVLEGNVIRVTGEGRYRFDKRLDFNVRVQLLRESTVAKVLNIITYPITKLFLEFHLGGSVDEPNWRPVNLPKEMYLIFD